MRYILNSQSRGPNTIICVAMEPRVFTTSSTVVFIPIFFSRLCKQMWLG